MIGLLLRPFAPLRAAPRGRHRADRRRSRPCSRPPSRASRRAPSGVDRACGARVRGLRALLDDGGAERRPHGSGLRRRGGWRRTRAPRGRRPRLAAVGRLRALSREAARGAHPRALRLRCRGLRPAAAPGTLPDRSAPTRSSAYAWRSAGRERGAICERTPGPSARRPGRRRWPGSPTCTRRPTTTTRATTSCGRTAAALAGDAPAADLARLPDPLRAAAPLGARGRAAPVFPLLPLAGALRRPAGDRVPGDADRAGHAARRAGAPAAGDQRQRDQAQPRRPPRRRSATTCRTGTPCVPGPGSARSRRWTAPRASRCSAAARWPRAGPATPPS